LVEYISRFPQEVQRAAKGMKPLILTNYAFELARSFNDFYASCPVLTEKEEIRNFRIRLVAAARQTIINSLKLLGLTLPNVM
jgi:arginyl-tRNA synthetase